MNILLNNGENKSSCCQLNYVASKDNMYLIDNHLAAIWCMAKLDCSKHYNFLHIDQHYDLVKYDKVKHSEINDVDLQSLDISQLTSFRTMNNGLRDQLITWDNYINLFNQKFPEVLQNSTFVTQKKGNFSYNKDCKQIEFYDIFDHYLDETNHWIFNIDLDCFFTTISIDEESKKIQMYSDAFIEEFAEWLNKKNKEGIIEQIIFCLSPECCGGWDNSWRVWKLIAAKLELNDTIKKN